MASHVPSTRGPQHGPGEAAQRPVAIVLGSDHIGSAVAHRLHCDGFAVALLDRIDPPWTRRGMSFVDAWYMGGADLADLHAIFCASVRSMPAVLWRNDAIATSAWSWAGVASVLAPALTVEARTPSRRTPLDRSVAAGMLMIDIVPGAVTGIEFAVPVTMPARSSEATHPLHAPRTGRCSSPLQIGDHVRKGDGIGYVGTERIEAEVSGTLCGLSARGALAAAGDVVAEIGRWTTREQCFGLDPYAVAVASAVARAVNEQLPIRPAASARSSTATRPPSR